MTRHRAIILTLAFIPASVRAQPGSVAAHLSPDALGAATTTVLVLFFIAVLLESALAVLFNWRPFVETFNARATPTKVPPVPTMATQTSTRPPLCSQISGPVPSSCARALLKFSNWWGRKAPRSRVIAAARSSTASRSARESTRRVRTAPSPRASVLATRR